MQNLSLLINKYQEGTASVEELYALLDLLDKQESELYREWESDIKNMGDSQSEQGISFNLENNKAAILIKLQKENGQVSQTIPDIKVRKLFRRDIAVAAICIGVLLLTSLYYWTNKSGTEKQETINVYAGTKATVITAIGEQKTIRLTDSSEVLLYAGSTLEYDSSYNADMRKLLLNGRARFTVKNDKQRPFVVYTKNNITTALGTVFEVAQMGDSTIVHLLEGSVKVQARGDKNETQVLLTPQQRAMTYNKQTALLNEVGEIGSVPLVKNAALPTKNNDLNFKQASLEKVILTLQEQYKVKIKFDKAEMAGMLFTGTFQESEEIKNILAIIATINNLTITANDQGFTITK
jgi:transmembrane sensor